MVDPVPVHEGPVPTWLDRLLALGAVGGAAGMVWLLAPVTPDARGFGTHEALGWTPCGWPVTYGLPCPTCGCTTAACLVVHLHWLDAFLVHPFGAAFAVFVLGVGGVGLHDLLRCRSFVARAYGIRLAVWVPAAIALLGGSWLYKWLTWK